MPNHAHSATASKDNVLRIVRNLFTYTGINDASSGADVNRIVVAGHTEDGEMEVLDLLKYRMQEVENVDSTAKRRRLKFESRRDALLRALGKRRNELRRYEQQ